MQPILYKRGQINLANMQEYKNNDYQNLRVFMKKIKYSLAQYPFEEIIKNLFNCSDFKYDPYPMEIRL